MPAEKPKNANFEDLTGRRFGRMRVTAYAGKSGRNSAWFVRCDCGSESRKKATNLKRQQSCGCALREEMSKRQTTHGATRGGTVPTEFRIWEGMNRRCYEVGNAAYSHYGGRGITVCDRWRNGDGELTAYECFLADMGRRPSPSLSIDRIDNDGDYEPGNCRWATWTEQQRNRTGCHLIKWDEEVITIQEACDRVGLSDVTVHGRLRLGWTMQDAVTRPLRGADQSKRLANVRIEDIGVSRRDHGVTGDHDAARIIIREAQESRRAKLAEEIAR